MAGASRDHCNELCSSGSDVGRARAGSSGRIEEASGIGIRPTRAPLLEVGRAAEDTAGLGRRAPDDLESRLFVKLALLQNLFADVSPMSGKEVRPMPQPVGRHDQWIAAAVVNEIDVVGLERRGRTGPQE